MRAAADTEVAFGLYVNNGGLYSKGARSCVQSGVSYSCEPGSNGGGEWGWGWGSDERCDVSGRKWRNSSSGRVLTRVADGRARARTCLLETRETWRGENQSRERRPETEGWGLWGRKSESRHEGEAIKKRENQSLMRLPPTHASPPLPPHHRANTPRRSETLKCDKCFGKPDVASHSSHH